jgi:septum formation protein
MRLILASTSPRRREILALLGVPFEVIEPSFDERLTDGRAIEEEVLAFARGKAQSVARDNGDAIVIGSDTMIGVDGEKYGKPTDAPDARRMLHALGGKTHAIFTAVVIIDGLGGSGLEAVEQVAVDVRPLSDAAIDRYIACGESLDKAGAYSIQGAGAELIAAIRGDYLAAVGLPLKPIANYLSMRGMPPSFGIERIYREQSFLNWSRFSP